MLAEVEPTLTHADVLEEFLDLMMQAPLIPRPLRPIQHIMIRAAFELIPSKLRETLELDHRRLTHLQLRFVKLVGRIADRTPITAAPPVQASIRMGRDPFFLYR